MDIALLGDYFEQLPEEQKYRFFKNIDMLFNQESNGLLLKGPFRLILDSNILMRLEEIEKDIPVTAGLLAVFCFFDYFKKQTHYQADVLILPSVFYEYCRQRNFNSFSEYEKEFRKLKELIFRILGVETYFDEIASFPQTEKKFKDIEHDVSLITFVLEEINQTKWQDETVIDYVGTIKQQWKNGINRITSPRWAAFAIFQDIETKYFKSEIVTKFIQDHIAFIIANHPKNDLGMADPKDKFGDYHLRLMLHLEKGRLKGLADIEILTVCNTTQQFSKQENGQYFPASIPLTLDDNLYKSLLKNTVMVQTITYDFSSGESLEDFTAKSLGGRRDWRERVKRADEQTLKSLRAQADYFSFMADLVNQTTK